MGIILPTRPTHLLHRPLTPTPNGILPAIRIRKGQIISLHIQLLRAFGRLLKELLNRPSKRAISIGLAPINRHRPMNKEHIPLRLDRAQRVDRASPLGHNRRQRLVCDRHLKARETDERLDGGVGELEEVFHHSRGVAEAERREEPAFFVGREGGVLHGETRVIVDAQRVGGPAGEDGDALDVGEGFEDFWEGLGRVAGGVLQAIADEPGARHVGDHDGVDEVHVWVVGLRGD